MIKQRQQRAEAFGDAAVRRNVVAVIVPRSRCRVVTQVERDETRTGFDKSSGNQSLLTPQMISVSRADSGGFLLNIKRLPCASAKQ